MSSKIAKLQYPLGHSYGELARLELQAQLFHDDALIDLAIEAENCLEIGAAQGSNWPRLEAANPRLHYTGIDLALDAITLARRMHAPERAKFIPMDARKLQFPPHSFDLVFSKLVLWSIGSDSTNVVAECVRVLKPGGILYAFEPYNQALTFYPAKPNLLRAIESWDEYAKNIGLDPDIGIKTPTIFSRAGLVDIELRSFPVVAFGGDKQRYELVTDNLRKFYFESSKHFSATAISEDLKKLALKELEQFEDANVVIDSFIVTIARKPNKS